MLTEFCMGSVMIIWGLSSTVRGCASGNLMENTDDRKGTEQYIHADHDTKYEWNLILTTVLEKAKDAIQDYSKCPVKKSSTQNGKYTSYLCFRSGTYTKKDSNVAEEFQRKSSSAKCNCPFSVGFKTNGRLRIWSLSIVQCAHPSTPNRRGARCSSAKPVYSWKRSGGNSRVQCKWSAQL